VTSNLAVGINYKLIQFRQECSGDCTLFPTAVGTTHGVDVGAQYAFGASRDVIIGLAIQHAGFKLQVENQAQADPLPTRIQIGVVYKVVFPDVQNVEEPLDARLLFDLRQPWGSFTNPDARVGLEVGVGETVRLRTGYAFLKSERRGPSVGIGLSIGRLRIDFAQLFFVASNFDEPVHISLRAIF
jgi:hypothetical protein